MAFIQISDPRKRDEIVQDYINTKHTLRERYENDKAVGLEQKVAFEKQYQPLLKATKDSTKEITTELQSNRSINKGDRGYWKPTFVKSTPEYYLSLKTSIDKYYGIQSKGIIQL